MLPEQFEPLPVELWLSELRRLSDWCENAPGNADDEHAVRRAFHLAALAPLGISRIVMPGLSLDEVDALLDGGSVEEAARSVIGANASIDLVQLPQTGGWAVSFSLAGDAPVRFEAPDAVRAMIGGWAAFFIKAAD